MNPGFWHSNFWPDNFWHENFWQDFGGIATTALHIFSTSNIEPVHVSDSGDNVLVAGDVEAQGDVYATDMFLPDLGALALGITEPSFGAGIFWNEVAGGGLLDTTLYISANGDIFIEATNTKIGSSANHALITGEGVVSQEGTTGSRELLRYSLMGI